MSKEKYENFGEDSSSDRSDTVLTGFNTEEETGRFEDLLTEQELKAGRKRPKSQGKEAKPPSIIDTPAHSKNLGEIEELNESDIDGDSDLDWKKNYQSPAVRLAKPPEKRVHSNPFQISVKKMVPLERRTKNELANILNDDSSANKIMRSTTMAIKKTSSDTPDENWQDLPDSIEKKNVKLSKKQKAVENELK